MEKMNNPTKSIEDQAADVFLILNSTIITISSTEIKIGRHIDNDIVISKEAVSRWHSTLKYESEEYVLYDNGSTSGTYVNQKRINRCVLFSGDLISLAGVPIMFVDNASTLRDRTKEVTQSLAGDL